MQTARRLVKGPDTAETSKRHLAAGPLLRVILLLEDIFP